MSDRDEEIADLERKLEQLKKESASKEENETSAKEEEEVDEEETLEALLSEKWKEEDSSNSSVVSTIGTIAAVVIGIVGLVAFAQVPIGVDDYAKYSSVKSSTKIDLGDLNEARSKATEGL